MADIFLLFLDVYDYSAISTVISGSHLTERFVYLGGQQHLSEMQQGKENLNQIKERLKLPLIQKKCLKACWDHSPEPCHPAWKNIYVWGDLIWYLEGLVFHDSNHSVMSWGFHRDPFCKLQEHSNPKVNFEHKQTYFSILHRGWLFPPEKATSPLS